MTSDEAMGRCLITGASGFIGRALFDRLTDQGVAVRGTSRNPSLVSGDWVQVGEMHRATDWSEALRGCDVVVHAAGRAHVLHEQGADPLTAFRQVNVDGTLALARQALEMGVRRFVLISSIGANGAETISGQPFSELSTPQPQQAYARSKLEAEQGLRELLAGQPMEWVVVRPPLVYAGDAPGNFGRLLGLVSRRVPLPLGRVNNVRSMIALQNLVSFLELCMRHPAAANETFVIADGEDVSTAQLVGLLAQGMDHKARLLPVPAKALRWLLSALGRDALGQQLVGSLQVDAGKARALLGWQPEVSTREALRDSARQWLSNRS
ncbi:NAD-dependent epimerase/dehydratase family protein [Pseudomonas viridiflava]|uniref:NAD-dependent epimerase/dehydratase family protein n=1 Tax=Pseudomonas viridiflava TaxID=33069 RepID=UPI0031FA0473